MTSTKKELYIMCNIDFVVTWVDSNDPIWLEEKNFFSDTEQNELNSEERFRDWDFSDIGLGRLKKMPLGFVKYI